VQTVCRLISRTPLFKHNNTSQGHFYGQGITTFKEGKMTIEQELEHVRKEYDELADRLRARDKENLRLMNLLTEHGIEFGEDD
jgi:hypothetical protein